MAITGFKGLDARQSGTAILFRAFLQDSAGAIVTAGTTNLYIYELQSDGTIKSYDWADNTFKTTALGTEVQALTHRTGNNGGTNTGYWTYALATLTGFTVGAVYIARVKNTGASPTDQMREFVYGGSADGDMVAQTGDSFAVVKSGGTGDAAAIKTKTDFLPSATAGAAGGVFIAGSNAATTVAGLTTGALACTTITASGAVAFQSTFAVTTSTSLAALSCTTLTASGAVAFQSTFAVTTSTALAALSCTTLTASGAVAFQSTFAVTTSTSLAALSATTITASGAVAFQSTFIITGATTFTGAITGTNGSNDLRVNTVAVSGTTQTARDIGASVLLSNGTGTGQLKLASGYVAMTWADIAAPTTTVALTGTTIATTQKVDIETIKTRSVTCSGGVTVPAATLASTTNITTVGAVAGDVGGDVTGNITGNLLGNVIGLVGGVDGMAVQDIVDGVFDEDAGVHTGILIHLDADVSGVANAVLDAVAADHNSAGTIGEKINDAGSAGDPWATDISTGYTGSEAGAIVFANLNATVGSRSTLTQTQVTGGAYSVQSASCVLGDARIANLDAAVTTRMATYTQPTGFLGATFPSDPADQSLVIAATDAIVTLIGVAGAGLTALGDTRLANLDATVSSRSTLTQTNVTGGAYSIQSASCVLGDARIANLDATVASRMATYTQPTGFLAATFPSGTIANTTNITAATGIDVTKLNGTSIAGTSSRVADAFVTFFNVATPVLTTASVNQTGDAYAQVGVAGAGLTALGDARLANLNASITSRMAAFSLPTNFAALGITGGGAVLVDGTSPLTEAYTTGAFTLAQGMYEISQAVGELSKSGTTLTANKRDGVTTAATWTLDDGTTPTSRTRAS